MIHWPENNEWLQTLKGIRGKEPSEIRGVASFNNPKNHALHFASKISPDAAKQISACRDSLFILSEELSELGKILEQNNAVIYSTDPRYLYAEILNRIFTPISLRGKIVWDPKRGINIGERVTISPNAMVEPGTTIADDCVIADGACILTGARIGPGVRIGKRSVIKENCVVGGWGFGYAMSKGKPPLRIPHLGGVVIGEDCEVGSFTTVCSGTIDPTILEDHVKVDDHCHIAHNVYLEEEVMVVACAEVSGSVRVGKRSWLGPNCSIIDRITIGSDCTVGMGAVVRKSLPDGSIVAGNPARPTEELKRDVERLKRLEELLKS